MASIRSLSLRRKLPLLVSSLTAGALLLAGALAYIEVRNSAIQAVEARLGTVTAEIANASSTGQAGRLARDSIVARSPRVLAALQGQPPDSAALAQELAILRVESDGDLPVLLIGPDDRTVFAAGSTVPGPDPDPDPRLDSVKSYGFYRKVGADILYWNSFPVRAPGGGAILGWVAHRRRLANTPQAGGLVESLLGTGIRFLIGQRSDSVWIDLIDRTVASPPAAVRIDQPYRYTSADAGEVLAVASELPPTTQVVVLQMPMAQVLARPHAFLSRMMLMGITLVLVVVVVAWRATRHLTGPLEDLAVAAEHMAGGDYRRRVSTRGDDEVDRVARSFNAMSEQVARSDEALRGRLEEARALAVRLEEANVSAERSREEAQAASRAKSEFLATMSHELRTPINAVLGYTELLGLGIPDQPSERQRDYLRRIERSSRLLIALVDDVLDLSRIESGGMRLEMGVGSTVDAVHSAVAVVEPDARRKGVALDARCGDGGRFRGDQQRVQQILLNLISNAIKFTPAGGSVRVSCSVVDAGPAYAERERGSWVRFDVEDTGIGIDPDQLERVFEPFVQGTVGFTREHGGAGLGLAISRSLASMMSGELTVESTPGQGSRFTLWLRAVGAGEAAAAPR